MVHGVKNLIVTWQLRPDGKPQKNKYVTTVVVRQ